jgi:phosphatidylethanolamine/phosphatidyl-N-methylethanolamine N-methyltransferase
LRQSFPAPDRGARVRPRPTLEQRFADEARFIKAWLDNPLVTGAVYPSGKVLSRTMARAVDPAIPGPIVELGPGTGPVTEALIQRGIAQERLVLVEFDPDFCRLLARRYPRATIVEGDAYRLARSLANVLAEPAAAIVSSLPLLTKPEARRLALLEEAFGLMQPDGVFVQFTYGLTSPVPRVDDRFEPTRFSAKGTAPVWLNLPPARVWTYRAASGREELRRTQPALIFKWKAKSEELGDEWRETRARLRREFVLRSEKAKAEIRARTEKVKSGLERHQARMKLAKAEKRPFELFERSRKGQRDQFW